MGFPKDPKLGTRYVEIPLDYSVIMREPIITQNIADDEISRLLVGRISDPDIGDLEAKAYFNFSPPIESVFPTENAVFVSLKLILKFDYYTFGATDSSDMQLTIHEVDEQLTPERVYYSGTTITYNAVPVGDTTFALGPQEIKEGWELATDNDATNNEYFNLPITINGPIGPSLLHDLTFDRNTIDDFAAFSARYKGFAVTMPVGNKILGFTPVYTLPTPLAVDSRIELTYTESGTRQTVDFPIYYATPASSNNSLSAVVSYSYLEPTRTGTAIDGLLPFVDLVPTDGNLYAQSGTGIMPKVDLAKFYNYFDTVKYPVINTAELVLDNTYTGRTPQNIELLLLDSANDFRPYLLEGTTTIDPYFLLIGAGIVPLAVGTDSQVAMLNELSGSNTSIDQATGKVNRILVTEFFQQLLFHKNEPRKASSFALHPLDNEFNKSVSLLKLSPSSAKLRVYYSTPSTP